MGDKSGLAVAIFIVAVFIISTIFYVHALYSVHKNCTDGHVVKNVFDWPVCVH